MDLFLRNCFQETEGFLIAEQEGCVLDGTKATLLPETLGSAASFRKYIVFPGWKRGEDAVHC